MACIGLVQAFGREADEFDHFRGTVRETIKSWWRLNREQMTYNLLIGALFGVGGAVIFGYGGWLVHRDQFIAPKPVGGMTLGDLMVFTAFLGMLWGRFARSPAPPPTPRADWPARSASLRFSTAIL